MQGRGRPSQVEVRGGVSTVHCPWTSMTEDTTPLAVADRLLNAFEVGAPLFDELRQLHSLQWQLEDQTRMPNASPAAVSSAKARIDICNARRHQLIDAIDDAIVGEASVENPTFYSETVGELCDRLIILELKREALGHTGSTDARSVARLCVHLAQLTEQLIADCGAQRAALPPRVGVKVYAGFSGIDCSDSP